MPMLAMPPGDLSTLCFSSRHFCGCNSLNKHGKFLCKEISCAHVEYCHPEFSADIDFNQETMFLGSTTTMMLATSTKLPMVKRLRDQEQPRGKTFLREWRVYRDLTQDYVAEIMGTSKTTISKIETGRQPYTQDSLEQLARIYGCTPGNLIDHDPRVLFARAPATGLVSGLSKSELETLKQAFEILRLNVPPDDEGVAS